LPSGNLLNQTDQVRLQSVAKLSKCPRTPERSEGIECLEITHDPLASLVVHVRKELEERRLNEAGGTLARPSAWSSISLGKRAAFRWWCPVVRASRKEASRKSFCACADRGVPLLVEGAKVNSSCGDHFAAALTAARALEFVGYFRLPLWQTPMDRQEEDPILSAAGVRTERSLPRVPMTRR